MSKKYYKGYKVKLDPTPEQTKQLFRFAGAARFIWNYFLSFQKEHYEIHKKYKNKYELSKLFTELRNNPKYSWLKEISFKAVRNSVYELDRAIWNCVDKRKNNKKNFPVKKTRKNKKFSFYPGEPVIWFKNNCFNIMKIGYVKLKEFNYIPIGKDIKYIDPRISFDGVDWWLSISIECETQTLDKSKTTKLGIDVGINNLITLSTGEQFQYPKKLLSRIKFIERRLRKLHQLTSKCYLKMKQNNIDIYDSNKTKNLLYLEMLIRKCYRRLTNIRKDFIHKLTTSIIQRNPEKIITETLNVREMKTKNNRFNKRLYSSLVGEILIQLEYKSIWNEIEFIKADKYFPSSKMCSICGNINYNFSPFNKYFTCGQCFYWEHRDINAAQNLYAYENTQIAG